MQPIQGFDNIQATHGRQGILPGGPYVMVIVRAKEDVTGYGNPCVKVVYDIAEGQFAGKYADLANDTEQDWRHEVEIDTKEANGGRFKALIDAVIASNPGYVWDWNEQGLVGKVVGIVLQERKITLTKGKNRGKNRTYLDFWDAVPADAVRQGLVHTPPVNDQRERKDEPAQQAQVPPTFNPQPAPQAPQIQPQQTVAPQPYQQPMPQPTQYAPQPYQQPMAQPQPVPQADVYDQDIPF